MNGSACIAGRYAESFYGFIAGDACGDAVLADMQLVAGLFREVPEFRRMISLPHLRGERRIRLIESAIRPRVNPATWRFLLFLREKRRLDLLPEICTAMLRCQERAAGRQRVTLDIAFDEDATTVARIAAAVAGQPPARLIVEKHVKPGLLGGFRVLIDDKLHDYSTAGAMRRLQKRMTTARFGKDSYDGSPEA